MGKNKELFPIEKIIKDSAIVIAFLIRKLTDEQIKAKNFIFLRIMKVLTIDQIGELILVIEKRAREKSF